MNNQISLSAYAPDNIINERLDKIASKCFVDYSRSLLQKWILSGNLLVDGKKRKPKDTLLGGEQLTVEAILVDTNNAKAENISLNIVYEDEDILVVNKPKNMVVHPGAGNPSGTLMNAILNHCKQNIILPRAGIVHRLDKDTTGLMVIAKTMQSHYALINCIKNREITREYVALVYGVIKNSGTIEAPIGRHPKHRTKMAVSQSGKPALTHYKVIKNYANYSYVQLKLDSGRTHQIRVHMEYYNHPIVGDPVYIHRKNIKGSMQLIEHILNFNRQALHAKRLKFEHPCCKKTLEFTAAIPDDFNNILNILESENRFVK